MSGRIAKERSGLLSVDRGEDAGAEVTEIAVSVADALNDLIRYNKFRTNEKRRKKEDMAALAW